MMHYYSNWLIGVKNRACIRDASRHHPGETQQQRGRQQQHPGETLQRGRQQQHHHQPPAGRRASKLAVGVSLWKKGVYVCVWGGGLVCMCVCVCVGGGGGVCVCVCVWGGGYNATSFRVSLRCVCGGEREKK